MIRAEHVAGMDDRRYPYRVLWGDPREKNTSNTWA
jgi:hypothetical protein